jgi:hypothetical protein
MAGARRKNSDEQCVRRVIEATTTASASGPQEEGGGERIMTAWDTDERFALRPERPCVLSRDRTWSLGQLRAEPCRRIDGDELE